MEKDLKFHFKPVRYLLPEELLEAHETLNSEAKPGSIEEFCYFYKVRFDTSLSGCGRESSVQESWEKSSPVFLVWIATRPGVLTEKELRLFSVWSSRQVQHLMEHSSSLEVLDVAESFARGLTKEDQLRRAWHEARRTAESLDLYPSNDVRQIAAWSAALAGSLNLESVAEVPRWASIAAHPNENLAFEDQARWLRGNVSPNFTLASRK